MFEYDPARLGQLAAMALDRARAGGATGKPGGILRRFRSKGRTDPAVFNDELRHSQAGHPCVLEPCIRGNLHRALLGERLAEDPTQRDLRSHVESIADEVDHAIADQFHSTGSQLGPIERLHLEFVPAIVSLPERGDRKRDLEAAVLAGGEGATEVPLGQARGVLAVEAVGVGVPQLHRTAGQRGAVGRADLAAPHQRGAGLVVAHGHGALGALLGGVRHVVRALDAALVAGAVRGRDLLDDVLDPHVEEQRPLAVLADADQPRLEGVVLGVGDLVAADGVVHGQQHLGGQRRDALLRHVEGRGGLLALEGGGSPGAGLGGLRVELGTVLGRGHGHLP